MPPRHAYWTIIVDDQPTAFRAHDVEELLPTFNRLREKHPNAQLRWFERGKLWESRDAAREQGFGQGERRWEGPRPERDDQDNRGERPEARRDHKWRPGGEHRDPRQKYQDAKKAKWDRYKQNIRARWEDKKGPREDAEGPLEPPTPDRDDRTPPHGDPMRRNVGAPAARPEWRRDDRRPQGREDRRDDGRQDRGGERRDRPREFRREDDRRGGWQPGGPRKPWGAKPGGAAKKPWGPKAGGHAKKPWGAPAAGPARKSWGGPAASPTRKSWGGPAASGDGKKSWGGPAAGGAQKKSWGGPKAGSAKKPWGAKAGGARKPWSGKPSAGGFRGKPFRSGPPRGPRGPKKPRGDEE